MGQVVENRQWTKRLFSLRIRAELLPFKAGQFVRLQLPLEVDGKILPVAKPYSLINSPSESVAEIFYNIVPGGRLSGALAALQVGDAVELSQPASGFFVLDEIPAARELWMLATGTGLGPYLSILKTPEVWQRFGKIVLVHGVPLREELAYADLLDGFRLAYPEQFRFVSCVSREENPHGFKGRITTAFASGELERLAGSSISPEHSHVMLCGNHNMLNDMKTLLGERGLYRHLRHKPGHITTEQYF
jgi:ferredoxin--NADP+ reductase